MLEKQNMHSDIESVLLSTEQIWKRFPKSRKRINSDYAGKTLCLSAC